MLPRQIERTPALGLAVSFALGIYLTCTFNLEHYGYGCLAIGCGALLYVLSCLMSGALAWRLHRVKRGLLYLSIGVMTCGMGGLRQVADSSAHLVPDQEEATSLRKGLVEHLKHSRISPEVQRLMAAIALGYLPQGEAEQALRQSFALGGVAHILAVSGYHLGVIALVLSAMLRLLRLPTRGYYGVLLVGIWLFTALTDFGIPTVRAAIMLSLYYIGKLLGYKTEALNLLAGAFLLQLLYSPADLYRWSMWLSYVAMLSIILYYRPLRNVLGSDLQQPWLRYLWNVFALTLSVQLLVLPLCLHLFGYVSWSFLFTSLPMTLLSLLFIPLSLMAYLWVGFDLPLGPAAYALEALGDLMLSVAQWGSELEILVLETHLPLEALLLCWGALLLLAYRIRAVKQQTILRHHDY